MALEKTPSQQPPPYNVGFEELSSNQLQLQQQQQHANPIEQSQIQILHVQNTRTTWPNYGGISSAVLGGIQIAIAIASILINATGLFTDHFIFFVSPGFWCSPFMLISGSVAIAAAKKKTTCLIISNMVLSIITAVLCFAMFGLAATVIAITSVDYNSDSEYLYWDNLPAFNVNIALGSSLLICSLLGIICAVILSGLSCAAVCCGNSKKQTVASARVIYNPEIAGQQQLSQPQSS